jgi:hypothetical protein
MERVLNTFLTFVHPIDINIMTLRCRGIIGGHIVVGEDSPVCWRCTQCSFQWDQ